MSGCTVDFPLYGITDVDTARVAICGGGGSVKSGVPNIVEVYNIRGKGMTLKYRYDCDRVAPTCIASHPADPILAVGVENSVLILEIEKQQTLSKKIPSLRKVLEREVVKATEKGGEIVKAITFCCYGEKMVTVGEDNSITIWEFPSMVRRWRITQHLTEVTQVIGHSNGEPEIVTATRGSECMVWDVETGQQTRQLKFTRGTEGVKYRFRNIRYGGGSGGTFYAVILPTIWTRQCTSHVVKYSTANWEVVGEGRMRGEPLAELALSPDDTLLATASSNGHVFVYDTFSMGIRRCIMEAHGLFVTGLTFMPTEVAGQFKLLSVSADRQCKIHNPHLADPGRYLRAIAVLLLFIGLVYVTLCILQSFDLLPHINDFDSDPPGEGGEESVAHHQHKHHNEL